MIEKRPFIRVCTGVFTRASTVVLRVDLKAVFRVVFLLLLGAVFGGCDIFGSDDGGDDLSGSEVVVVNGGNFGDQNGHLTTYDPETGAVGQGESLNGFAQGVVVDNDRAYVLVNTFSTGHVNVLELESLTSVGRFEPLPAPRGMAVHDGIAYVTNFIFGSPGQVVPVPIETGEPGDPIEMGSVLEGITVMEGRVFVADNGNLGAGKDVFTFQPGSSEVRSVDVGCDGPRDLFPATAGYLVILCTGKTVYNDDFSEILSQTPGAVVLVDPNTLEVTGRVTMVTQLGATNGTLAGFLVPETDVLYATAADANIVYRIDTRTRTIDLILSIPPSDGLIGLSGIAYDSRTERLYVGRFPLSSAGDFPDYTSAGSVVVIDRFGEIETTFQVGPAPSQILLLGDPDS